MAYSKQVISRDKLSHNDVQKEEFYLNMPNNSYVMWDSEFLKACESSPNEEIKKMHSVIEQTLKFLSSLPHEITVTVTDMEYLKELMKKDYYKGVILYWKEIDERIKFLWQSMSLKGLSLLKNITVCINSKNYFPALVSTRALLENVAVFHYYLWKIIPTYNEIVRKIIKREITGIFISSELENLLIRYTHGTRLKELLKVRKEWKQKRISVYIRFLSQNKKYAKASDYYTILCEIVHPNIGSNLVFYNTSYRRNKLEIHGFSEQQNINFFLNVSVYPLTISCEILKEGIKRLQEVKFVG